MPFRGWQAAAVGLLIVDVVGYQHGTASASSWGHAASRSMTFCASCGSTFRGMTTRWWAASSACPV
jgi:hypothetical protein